MSSITDLLTPSQGQFSMLQRGASFLLGSVTENNNEEFAGMVKVEFTSWKEGSNISRWIPVMSGYAGKEYGSYVMPEIGDIVVLGFIGNMMENPFVLGCMYPAGATLPGEQYHDENFNKHFKTKGGITLTISDEGGKEKLEVKTKKEHTISIEDESDTITIGDKDSKNSFVIDIKNGEVTLKADKKITFEVGSCSVVMEGGSGKMAIKANQLEAEGSQKALLKSGNMMNVEGAQVTIDGKQTKMAGTAMCEISGGMVKIN